MRSNTTALIAVAPQAECLLRPFIEQYVRTIAVDVPAHITLAIPFKPRALIDDQALNTLSYYFANTPPFHVTLQSVQHFPDAGALYLAPKPTTTLEQINHAVYERFPELVPDFATYIPHLTIAHGNYTAAELVAIEQTFAKAYGAQLPIQETIRAVALFAKVTRSWALHTIFPLGG